MNIRHVVKYTVHMYISIEASVSRKGRGLVFVHARLLGNALTMPIDLSRKRPSVDEIEQRRLLLNRYLELLRSLQRVPSCWKFVWFMYCNFYPHRKSP